MAHRQVRAEEGGSHRPLNTLTADPASNTAGTVAGRSFLIGILCSQKQLVRLLLIDLGMIVRKNYMCYRLRTSWIPDSIRAPSWLGSVALPPLVERGPHHVRLEDDPTPTIAPPPLTWHARRSKADKSDDDEDQKNSTETSCWVMFTGCPSTSRLPPEVSSLINKAVVAAGRVRGVVDAD